MTFSDTAISYIRTGAPALAGLIIGWAVSTGLPVTGNALDALTAVLVGVFTFAWYAGVRLIEKKIPAAGWLLGVPRTPTYPPKPPLA